MTYSLLDQLSESRMFPSRKSFEHEDFKQISEGLFVIFMALRVLMVEDWKSAEPYLKKTLKTSNFENWRGDGTDLYLHCWALSRGEFKTSASDPKEISMVTVLRWLREMEAAHGDKEAETHRFFLRLDRLLYISDTKLRALRRRITEWPDLTDDEREAEMTQLIRIMRDKFNKCDLLKPLKRLLGRDELNESSTAGATSSANVAAVVKPLGGDDQSLGPGFGGTDQGIYGKKTETVLRRPAPSTIVVEENPESETSYPTAWQARTVKDFRGNVFWQVIRETKPEEGRRRGDIMRQHFLCQRDAEKFARGLNEGRIVEVSYRKGDL